MLKNCEVVDFVSRKSLRSQIRNRIWLNHTYIIKNIYCIKFNDLRLKIVHYLCWSNLLQLSLTDTPVPCMSDLHLSFLLVLVAIAFHPSAAFEQQGCCIYFPIFDIQREKDLNKALITSSLVSNTTCRQNSFSILTW